MELTAESKKVIKDSEIFCTSEVGGASTSILGLLIGFIRDVFSELVMSIPVFRLQFQRRNGEIVKAKRENKVRKFIVC